MFLVVLSILNSQSQLFLMILNWVVSCRQIGFFVHPKSQSEARGFGSNGMDCTYTV